METLVISSGIGWVWFTDWTYVESGSWRSVDGFNKKIW